MAPCRFRGPGRFRGPAEIDRIRPQRRYGRNRGLRGLIRQVGWRRHARISRPEARRAPIPDPNRPYRRWWRHMSTTARGTGGQTVAALDSRHSVPWRRQTAGFAALGLALGPRGARIRYPGSDWCRAERGPDRARQPRPWICRSSGQNMPFVASQEPFARRPPGRGRGTAATRFREAPSRPDRAVRPSNGGADGRCGAGPHDGSLAGEDLGDSVGEFGPAPGGSDVSSAANGYSHAGLD